MPLPSTERSARPRRLPLSPAPGAALGRNFGEVSRPRRRFRRPDGRGAAPAAPQSPAALFRSPRGGTLRRQHLDSRDSRPARGGTYPPPRRGPAPGTAKAGERGGREAGGERAAPRGGLCRFFPCPPRSRTALSSLLRSGRPASSPCRCPAR